MDYINIFWLGSTGASSKEFFTPIVKKGLTYYLESNIQIELEFSGNTSIYVTMLALGTHFLLAFTRVPRVVAKVVLQLL